VLCSIKCFVPFQDPSVQRAVANSAAANANLEDYNPFDPKQTQTKPGGDAPAVMKTDSLPPPYSAVGQQQISSADFQVNPFLKTGPLKPVLKQKDDANQGILKGEVSLYH